jgi:hypothetical protein
MPDFSLNPDAPSGPCWVCAHPTDDRCDRCARWICVDHAQIRRLDWDHAWADGIDVLCADHAGALPGFAIDAPRA